MTSIQFSSLLGRMSLPANVVSIHPYFKAHPGKADTFRQSLPAFIELTATEKNNLYYEFTSHEDEFFCREGYIGAEGVLAHLDNVGGPLGDLLKIAELTRLEIHGPAEEIDKLKGPLSALNPTWFTLECGVNR